MFLLVDLQTGVTRDDFDFLEESRDLRMGFDLIFCRADREKPEHWMQRAMAMTHQLRKHHDVINPVCHLASSK